MYNFGQNPMDRINGNAVDTDHLYQWETRQGSKSSRKKKKCKVCNKRLAEMNKTGICFHGHNDYKHINRTYKSRKRDFDISELAQDDVAFYPINYYGEKLKIANALGYKSYADAFVGEYRKNMSLTKTGEALGVSHATLSTIVRRKWGNDWREIICKGE